ncbi:MAG: ferredoxin [Fibrobacterales bacterium]
MADISLKFEDNVPGKWYVDSECTGCELCTDHAPDNFEMSDDGGNSLVIKQPENEEEIEAMEAAMEECPVESIGKDGE